MALTFVRTGELIGAQWDEFEHLDGPEPTWRIPAVRMKMRTPHIVPLARQAVEVISYLQEIRERRKMMQAWADQLDVMRQDRKVIPLRSGRTG